VTHKSKQVEMFPNTLYILTFRAAEMRLSSDKRFLLEKALFSSLNLGLGIGISFPALSGTLSDLRWDKH